MPFLATPEALDVSPLFALSPPVQGFQGGAPILALLPLPLALPWSRYTGVPAPVVNPVGVKGTPLPVGFPTGSVRYNDDIGRLGAGEHDGILAPPTAGVADGGSFSL